MENWEKLCKMPYKEIKEMQDRKLRAFMANQIYLYSPHYSALLKEHKIDPFKIKSIEDLRHLPFTYKWDIAPTDDEPKKAKDFVIRPDEEVSEKYGHLAKMSLTGGKGMVEEKVYDFKPVHIHFTTGRTALPTPFVYSKRDLDNLRESGHRLLNVFKVTSEDRTVSCFPFAPHLAFWQTFFGGEETKVGGFHSGGGKIVGTNNLMDSFEYIRPTVAVFIPGYCYYFLREAVKQGRDFSSVQKVFFGGERVPPGLKDKIRELFAQLGAKDVMVLATYGMTEAKVAWAECPSHDEYYGYHLYPDMEIIETVDPETGEQVGEGEEGEIVFTAIDWRGTAVLRYRTGDIAKGGLLCDPCPNCGRTVPRISSNIQRKSEVKEFSMTKVKGTLVNLNNFFPLMMSHPDIEEWQIEMRKRNNDPFDLDEIYLHLSTRPGIDRDKLAAEMRQKVIRDTEVSLTDIIFKPIEELCS
ncbi:MAG TPA: AMP-binding protein, partial [Candidatus Limnocylindrales bacterium]|nr:AMP-binding protein [Candidatus Limnocylindrales bacterium]